MSNWIRTLGLGGNFTKEVLYINGDKTHRIEVEEGYYGCYIRYLFNDHEVFKHSCSNVKMEGAKEMAVRDIKATIFGELDYWQKLKTLTDLEFEQTSP